MTLWHKYNLSHHPAIFYLPGGSQTYMSAEGAVSTVVPTLDTGSKRPASSPSAIASRNGIRLLVFSSNLGVPLGTAEGTTCTEQDPSKETHFLHSHKLQEDTWF